MNPVFDGLEPAPLWRYFDKITQIPRGSGDEEAILAYIVAEGEKRGLEVRRDAVDNVVLVIPAAAGCESWPTVVLQGHVDIVCEKNSDVEHDFLKDGIKVIRDGDWLTADGTTLGADNGIAVAAALAMLDDPPEKHPQLELLFTTDEERGLTGAGGIESHMLTGKRLLNMDSEEEGFVTVGCAGGGDTLVSMNVQREALSGVQLRTLEVRGLAGGHSGIDIHENRANSLRCIGRLLDRIARVASDMRLVTLRGGSKRNAIPREAFATIALSNEDLGHLELARSQVAAELADEFGATDPNLSVSVKEVTDDGQPWAAADTRRAIALLLATPSGVLAMDRNIVGLVETSTNLGVVEMEGDALRFVNCTRSSIGSARDAAQEALRAMAEEMGADVRLANAYPGWKPDLDAELLAIFKKVHEEVTGKAPEVMAIHAGLECGILGERFPGMEMISFGPDLKGVHAPGERLSIPSSQRFYTLLKALLGALD